MTRFDDQSGGGLEPSASAVSHRIQAILEQAEQAARDIRYEAEMEKRRTSRESDRRLAEIDDGLRRMSAVADNLVERADELRRQVDEMIGTLRRPDIEQEEPPRYGEAPDHRERPSRARYTGAGPRPRTERRSPEPPRQEVAPPEPEPQYVPPAPPEPEPEPQSASDSSPERLVAIQMALAGRSREEAADRLQRGFGMQDPSPILDELFG